MPEGWRKDLLLNWPPNRPMKLWVSLLRKRGIDPERHLTNSIWQERVEAMQKRLVW
jgi:hypothetical protein